MNIVAVIPAKGTSKRLPGKNIRPMLGKPLIAWTIEVALASKNIHRVIVSTDDEEIAAVAKKYGAEVPFMEPKEISAGGGNIERMMLHTVEWLEKNENYKVNGIMLLLPTNPLRLPVHLDECAKLYETSGVDCVAAVCEAKATHNPYWMFMRDSGGKVITCMGQELKDMPRYSQGLPHCYIRNDSCFVIRPGNLRGDTPNMWGENLELYPMDEIFDADINTQEDWGVAEDKLRRLLASEGVPTP